MSLRAIPCLLMRGGTSRGPYFDRADLPADARARERVLLAVMGSPDVRQIDGLGGADTLTSKVAIVGRSERPAAAGDASLRPCWVNIPQGEIDELRRRLAATRHLGNAPDHHRVRRSSELEFSRRCRGMIARSHSRHGF